MCKYTNTTTQIHKYSFQSRPKYWNGNAVSLTSVCNVPKSLMCKYTNTTTQIHKYSFQSHPKYWDGNAVSLTFAVCCLLFCCLTWKIHKYNYTNTNTQIQIQIFFRATQNIETAMLSPLHLFAVLLSDMQIHKWNYTNTNAQLQIQIFFRATPNIETAMLSPLHLFAVLLLYPILLSSLLDARSSYQIQNIVKIKISISWNLNQNLNHVWYINSSSFVKKTKTLKVFSDNLTLNMHCGYR